MKKILTCCVAVMLIISSVYSQDEEKKKQAQNFKNKYPGEFSFQWDKLSGGPKRIIGNSIYLKSRSVNKTNIRTLTDDFIFENAALLNVRNTELEFENISQIGDIFIVTNQQLYKKVPLWNAKIRLKVASNGQVLMIKSQCFDNPNISVDPKLSLPEAKNRAALFFNIDIKKSGDGELIIYPDRETGRLYLCWHIKLESGINKGLMIEAQTGQIVYEYDLYRNAEIRGTVETTTWSLPGQLGGTPDITTYCQDLKVNVTGVGSGNTNSSGYYSVTVPNVGNYTVTSSLDGPHCWVTNYIGSEASYSNTASTSSNHNWTWQQSDHYNEYFVFHYMNNAWHEFNNKVTGFSSNHWYSNKMEGWANENFDPGNANGYATGTYISMTPSNHFGCSVYHEYSHNVNYRNNGFWLGTNYDGDGRAMDEGLADYYSCSFRNDPLRYSVSRRLDTKMKYPGSGGAHTRGQILGGACWDLAHKSGMSLNYVNELVYEAVANMGFEETFRDFFDEIISADDNDGNIFNGTPHDDQICDAFINDHWILGSYIAGNISSNLTVNNDTYVISNSAITSGYTLTIGSGTTLNFSSGVKLSAFGILNADGATFQGNGTAGYWNSISYYANSSGTIQLSTIRDAQCGIYAASGASVSISNCIVSNNTLYGISLNNSASNTISGCTIQNNGTGINIYSVDAVLSGNNILDNDNGIIADDVGSVEWEDNDIEGNDYAVVLENASTYFFNNMITNNDHGLSITSGDPSFGMPYQLGYNAITCGVSTIYANNSTVYMGYGYNGGYNSIYRGSSFEIEAYNSSGIYADNNYWGSNPTIYTDGTSWVLSGNRLTTDPNPGSYCLPKANASNVHSDVLTPIDISENYWRALDEGMKGNLGSARNLLHSLIEGGYDENYSPLSLLALYDLKKKNPKNSELSSDLTQTLSVLYHSQNKLRPFAIRLLEREAALSDDFVNVVAYNKELTEAYPNSIHEVSALYNLISYYVAMENNSEEAGNYFEKMKGLYPEERLTLFASIKLGQNFVFTPKIKAIQDTPVKEFSLGNAYPNPFNPNTTIEYQIPKTAKVSLIVYDMLGQAVAILVNEYHEAGKYTVEFDASSLPSGIYLYEMKSGEYSVVKKMLLIK